MVDSVAKEKKEHISLDDINLTINSMYKILNKFISDYTLEKQKGKRKVKLLNQKDFEIKNTIIDRMETYNKELFTFKTSLENKVQQFITKDEISSLIDSKFEHFTESILAVLKQVN